MISHFPFRALVTLRSGQPPDSKACHSSARSYSIVQFVLRRYRYLFISARLELYCTWSRKLMNVLIDNHQEHEPNVVRSREIQQLFLFLERFLSHAPHLSSRIIVFPNPDLISQHFIKSEVKSSKILSIL